MTVAPRDVLLLARMTVWAAAAPVLKRVLPLPRLVRLAATGKPRARDRAREQRVIAAVTRIYRSGLIREGDNCLERSLVTYRFLGPAGSDPKLVVGMSRVDKKSGHVWVLVDGRPVHDTDETLRDMEPLFAFSANGSRVDV